MRSIPIALSVLAVLGTAPLASAHVLDPGGTVDWACAPGSPLRYLGPNGAEACGNFYGYAGYQAVKPCQPPGPNAVGVQRTVFQTAYEAAHEQAPCDPTLRDVMNETWAEARRVVLDATGPLLDVACGTVGFLLYPEEPPCLS